MEHIAAHSKAIVSAIVSILIILDQVFGIGFFAWLTADWITSLLAVLSPILVYLIPNRHPIAEPKL